MWPLEKCAFGGAEQGYLQWLYLDAVLQHARDGTTHIFSPAVFNIFYNYMPLK